MQEQPLRDVRIGIFGKGGSGKSTVTVLLARALRYRGYPVAVIDADSTNVGLAQALGIEREPAPLLDLFGGMVFSGGSVTCPVDDPTPLPDATLAVDELPQTFVATSADGIRLLVAGKLGPMGPGAGCDGPIAKIARDVRVTDVDRGVVTLVDFKAGFEDSARGALTSLHWVLAVVDPTVASVQLAIHLDRMVRQIRQGVPPATRHLESVDLVDIAVRQFLNAAVRGVLAVLNRVPDRATEQHLRHALEGQGPPVIGSLAEDRSIQAHWLRGRRLEAAGLERTCGAVVAALEVAQQPAPTSLAR
jgi:CO dehydrogenase nickel-insertion accessory protein CooC1